MNTLNNVVELHVEITKCSRCGDSIRDGDRATSVSVMEEVLHQDKADSTPYVDVVHAQEVHIFCMKCSRLYNFKKIGVGRKFDEEYLVLDQQYEEHKFACGREGAAKALGVSPESLADEQIQGWLLEQDYLDALEAHNRNLAANALGVNPESLNREQIIQWVDANQKLACLI